MIKKIQIMCCIFISVPVISFAIEPDYSKLNSVSSVGISGRFIGFSTEIGRDNSFRHVFNLGTMRLDDERLANLSFRKIEPSWHEYSLTFGMEHNNYAKLELRHLGKIIHEVDRSSMFGEKHNAYGFIKGGNWLSGGKNGVIEVYNSQGEKLSVLEGHSGTITGLAYNEKWLVSGDSMGLMILWSLDDVTKGKKRLQPYLSMVYSKDNEWAIWSDEGVFSSSDKGNLLLDHQNNKIGVHTTEAIHRKPELLSKKVTHPQQYQKLVAAEIWDDKGVFNPPVLSIIDPPRHSEKRDQELTLRVCDAGGGVQSAILYLRGTPIAIEEATRSLAVKDKRPIPSESLGCNSYTRVISLVDGQNDLVLVANSYLGRDAVPAKASIGYVSEAKKKLRLHIATIAVTKYSNMIFDLKYPVDDAKALSKAFEKIGTGQFESVITYNLFNENAKKQNILSFIENLKNKINSEDVFVLFMAGHGQFSNSEYYFMPYDLNADNILPTALSTEDLMKALSGISVAQTLLLIDTCQSGGFDGFIKETQKVNTAQLQIAHRLGRASLMASSKEQAAFEGIRGHGAFTSIILDALNGAADYTKDMLITVDELSVYVGKHLPELTERKWGYRQEAIRNTTGHDFVLGALAR